MSARRRRCDAVPHEDTNAGGAYALFTPDIRGEFCAEGPYTSFRHMFGGNVFGLPPMGPAAAAKRLFDAPDKTETGPNRREAEKTKGV